MASVDLEYNQGFKIYNANGTRFNNLVLHKATYETVVMSLGDKISGIVYYKNNKLVVNMTEYIMYKNVKYVLVNPPTVIKEGLVSDNGELKGMTKYSFTFYHPMYMLSNFPFSDVAVDNSQKKYLSQNKTFSWIGNLTDYVAKLNKNLEGTQWKVSIGTNVTNAEKNKLSEVLSFDNNTIADALKTAYETWEIPYIVDKVETGTQDYLNGKRFVVQFGLPSNEIYEVDEEGEYILDDNNEKIPFVFKYGQGVGLKNNSRTPKNNKIVTRIAGYGSEDNIPYGYPQIVWTGNQSWNYTINNDSTAANSYPIYDGIVGGQKVRLIKHPFTRTHLMPPIYSETVNKKVNPNATGYNPNTELVDYYDANDNTYPNQIKAGEQSYEIHEFEDIKPEFGSFSINSAAPYDGHSDESITQNKFLSIVDDLYTETDIKAEKTQLNALRTSFVTQQQNSAKGTSGNYEYDWSFKTDGLYKKVKYASSGANFEYVVNVGLTPATIDWDDTMDEQGNYVQSYFKVTIPALGFDLYASAAITQEMTINMRSGACIGCSFPVMVDWDDYKRNFYDNDGNFAPNGTQRNYTKYPNSTNASITLILQKETSTFGTLMPNIYQKPASGDKFVILGISLPTSYITTAEGKLETEMKKYMRDNNVYYYEYPLKFDEHFLISNEHILSQMKPNVIVNFEYADVEQSLYIKQMSIKYNESPLPKYDITLTDDVDVVLNKIGEAIAEYRGQRQYENRGGNSETLDGNKFLRKDINDTASGTIRMLKGLQVGERFVTGLLGEGGIFRKDDDGTTYLECDRMYVRMKAYFDTVEVRRFLHSGGNRIASAAGMKCSRVECIATYNGNEVVVNENGVYWINANTSVTLTINLYRCYFRAEDNGAKVTNDFVVGDLAYCKETNIDTNLSQHGYWRAVVGVSTNANSSGEHWIDLSRSDCSPTLNDVPIAQDDIIQLGNKTAKARQGAIVEYVSGEDAPSYQIYQGINTYNLNNKNYIELGYSSDKGRAYMNVYGDFLFGDKAESTYIKYNAGTKKLEIKADVKFKNPDAPTQDTTLEDFASAVTDDIDNLQSQIDGQIETWFYDYDPTVANAPASNWTTISEKNNHLGDLFYNTTSGYAWRWGREETAPNVYEYKWYRITDVDVVKALADAAKAQDTADHKRRVFTAQPYPPYDVGDLWSNAIYPANNTEKDAANNKYYKDLLTCKTAKAEGGSFAIADWGLTTNYTDDTALTDFVSNTYSPFVQNIQGQVDQKAETWYQDTDPSTAWTTDALKASHVGDIWCDTSQNGGKKTYIWQDFGTSANPRYAWAEQAVPDAVFDKIDGKADIFVSKPTTYNVNDMWIIESGLSSTDMPTGCQSGDIVISSTSRVNNYQKADWSKKDRYTDDTKYNNFISALLNGMPQGSTEATVEAALNAIKAALNQGTTIGGGLVLTTLIGLRDSSDVLWSGISGAYDSTQLGNGIAAWYGGAMVDIESLTGTAKTAYDNLTPSQKAASANYAKTLFRFDGSGYLASTNIRWTADGKVYLSNLYTGSNNPISNLFFDAFAIGIDGSTSYINPQFTFNHIDIVRRTGVGDTITNSSVLNYGEMKSRFVSIDFFNRLFQAYSNEAHADNQKVNPNDTTTTINNLKILVGTWTDKYLSSLGLNSQSGGGGVGDVTWDLLASSSDTHQIAASHLNVLSGYVQTSALNNYLPLTGGTLTGRLNVTTDIIATKHIAIGTDIATYSTDRAELDIVSIGDNVSEIWLGNNGTRNWCFSSRISSESNNLNAYRNNGTSNVALFTIFRSCGHLSYYGNITANSIIKSGGTSSQFLKADGSVDSTSYLSCSGGDLNGHLNVKGYDIYLLTRNSETDDSGDIVFKYGNGQEKARLWTDNTYTVAKGINYRVYKKDGTSLYEGALATVGELSSYLPLAGGQMTGRIMWDNTNGNTTDGWNNYSFNVGMEILNVGNRLDTGAPSEVLYGTGLHISGNYWMQLCFSRQSNRFWIRGGNTDGVTTDGWQKLAYVTDTVDSATKLSNNTAYTAWGATFFTNGLPTSISNTGMTGVTSIDSLLYFDTTNSKVGVGTSAPARLFHVNGDALFQHHIAIGTNFTTYAAGRAELDVVSSTDVPCDIWLGANATRIWFISCRNSSEDNVLNIGDKIYIRQGGNVGIGINNPAEKLDVNGNVKLNEKIVFSRDSYNYIDIPSGSSLLVTQGGMSGANTKISVNSNGKVGINNMSASYALDVTGNIRATETSWLPALELSGEGNSHVPYIDFHSGGYVSGRDYSTRIIESSGGVLSLKSLSLDSNSGQYVSSVVGLVIGDGNNGDYIKIGDIYVGFDNSNTAIEIYKLDNHGNHIAANLYARGAVSALGANSQSGGGGVGDVTWDLLASNSDTNQIAASHLNVLNGYAQQSWVTNQGYITQTNADNRYLKLAGGDMTGAIRWGDYNGATADGWNPIKGLSILNTVGQNNAGAPYPYSVGLNVEGYYGMQIALYHGTGLNGNYLMFRGGYPTEFISWQKIWSENNDGSDSGLDADLLDGQHGSYYAQASALSDYVTLATAQTISGRKEFTKGIKISGRVYNSGDDEGIVIGWASNNFATISLGSHNSRRSTFTINNSSDLTLPRWVYYEDASAQGKVIYHPNKSGTIALTSDIPTTLDSISDGTTRKLSNYLPLSGGQMTGTIKWGSTNKNTADAWNIIEVNHGIEILSAGSSSIDVGGPTGLRYGSCLHVSGYYWFQLCINRQTESFWIRGGNNEEVTTGGWNELAYKTSNVASATKLNTARYLWGQSFDGTADVTGALSSVTNIDSLLYFDTTNSKVGVGTSAPARLFHVNGDALFQHHIAIGTNFTTYAAGRAELDVVSSTDVPCDIWLGTNAKRIWYLSCRPSSEDNVLNIGDKIYIRQGGNVGIGISSPAQKLDVNGNAKINGTLTGVTSINSVLYFAFVGTSYKIGIGTNDPDGKLHVNGNAVIAGTLTGVTSLDGLMYFNTTNTQTKFASNNTLVQLTRGNGTFTPKLYVDGYAGFNGEIYAGGLDLVGSNASGNVHGGYIDFHYNASTADFTTRIIESANGVISVTKSGSTASDITGLVVGNSRSGDYIQIGAIRIVYDSSNTALKVVGSNGSSAANFYATGAVSALGANSQSGGGGVGDVTWELLASAATNNRTIHQSYIQDAAYSLGDSRYIRLNGTSNITGDLIPASTASNLWLGSSSYHWTEGHIDNIYMDATTNDSKIQITGAASTLTINATSINNPAATLSIQNSNDARSLSLCSGGGNVGVGTSPNSSYKLYVNGNTYLNGVLNVKDFFIQNSGPNYYNIGANGVTVYQNGTWTGGSDIRRKDIVTNIGCDINQIASAPIFDFIWKADITRTVHVGTSAQYWSKVFENAVSEGGDGYLYMDYGATALASAVITARKVLDHEGRIRLLEIENQALRKEIEQLKKAA